MSGTRWFTSWPAIIAGFLLYAVPGAILLALRKGVRVRTKLIALAVSPFAALAMIAWTGAPSTEPDVPTAAASPVASPTPSATATATATPSVTPEPSATASSTPSASASPDATTPKEQAATGTALAAVDTLTVKGRAPKTGYDRDLFEHWSDPDRNGCDARNDILARDLTGITRDGCRVLTGDLADPYTATLIHFQRGQDTSSAVQIDHVVALSDAWQKGAQSWSAGTRLTFANDPLNLLAVDGPANASKGDGDTATWLPPNKAFRCQYVARQVAVKAHYDLWVTQAEADAMTRVLSTCPDEPLPEGGAPVDVRATAEAAPVEPAPAETTAPDPEPATGGTDPRYDTCKAAKAAGLGPYVQGRDEEYGWYRDGDSDGTVCE